MDKRKCLLLGDYTHPRFHPLQGVDQQISEILNDLLTVQCSENKKLMRIEHLASYDLCIAYNELWNETVSPQQTAGLLSYVSGGGGLIVLHTGASLTKRNELAQLIGGRFNGHTAYEPMNFKVLEHDITEGVEDFNWMRSHIILNLTRSQSGLFCFNMNRRVNGFQLHGAIATV